jgi:hypothetical protein
VTLISGLSGRHPLFHINLDDLIAAMAPAAGLPSA